MSGQSEPASVRKMPWSHCHFRGQDLLAVGLGREVLIIEAASLLLIQRLQQYEVSHRHARIGEFDTDRHKITLDWADPIVVPVPHSGRPLLEVSQC